MKILFLCVHITEEISNLIEIFKQFQLDICIITLQNNEKIPDGIQSYKYKIYKHEYGHVSDLLKPYELAILHSKKTYEQMKKIKTEFEPDIIIGFSQGNTLLVKDVFENVPFYYILDGENIDYTGDENTNLFITCGRSHIMSDLCYCDKAFAQKHNYEIFSKYFPEKIKCIDNLEDFAQIIKSYTKNSEEIK